MRCMVVLTLLLCGSSSEARAGSGHAVAKKKVDVEQRAVAIVPFAVPVAVPVAVIARPAVFYGVSRYVEAQPLPIRPVPGPVQAGRESLVQQLCGACHGGAAPKAGFNLADLPQLTPQARLTAVSRVVSDDPRTRMPPDRALSPAEIAALLRELAAE
jgi:mono/diheme cytochrome c family protein